MWRSSGRGCTVMPCAPASRAIARSARRRSGIASGRVLRSSATLLTLTDSAVPLPRGSRPVVTRGFIARVRSRPASGLVPRASLAGAQAGGAEMIVKLGAQQAAAARPAPARRRAAARRCRRRRARPAPSPVRRRWWLASVAPGAATTPASAARGSARSAPAPAARSRSRCRGRAAGRSRCSSTQLERAQRRLAARLAGIAERGAGWRRRRRTAPGAGRARASSCISSSLR